MDLPRPGFLTILYSFRRCPGRKFDLKTNKQYRIVVDGSDQSVHFIVSDPSNIPIVSAKEPRRPLYLCLIKTVVLLGLICDGVKSLTVSATFLILSGTKLEFKYSRMKSPSTLIASKCNRSSWIFQWTSSRTLSQLVIKRPKIIQRWLVFAWRAATHSKLKWYQSIFSGLSFIVTRLVQKVISVQICTIHQGSCRRYQWLVVKMIFLQPNKLGSVPLRCAGWARWSHVSRDRCHRLRSWWLATIYRRRCWCCRQGLNEISFFIFSTYWNPWYSAWTAG